MNLKKSINVLVATKGISKQDLADQLGYTRARLHAICQQKRINWETLQHIADVADMKVSELIALGEN